MKISKQTIVAAFAKIMQLCGSDSKTVEMIGKLQEEVLKPTMTGEKLYFVSKTSTPPDWLSPHLQQLLIEIPRSAGVLEVTVNDKLRDGTPGTYSNPLRIEDAKSGLPYSRPVAATFLVDLAASNYPDIDQRSSDLWHYSDVLPTDTLSMAFADLPEIALEVIRQTSFEPDTRRVICGHGRPFDHGMENFVTFMSKSGIHQHPVLMKALWQKYVAETPEATLNGEEAEFICRFMESQPNYAKFVQFVANDLFGRPRRGMVEPDSVIKKLVSVNGRWPNGLRRLVEAKPIDKRGRIDLGTHWSNKLQRKTRYLVSKKVRMAYLEKCWQQTERRLDGDGFLSVDESKLVIAKIDELFFS